MFINRHYTLLATTSSATFDDSADELEYAYGGDLANRVTVSITPRSIGAAATTLWRVDSAQRVNALSRREIIARYRDADKRSVGALAVIAPLPAWISLPTPPPMALARMSPPTLKWCCCALSFPPRRWRYATVSVR
ncbi:MAG: hypothetical protein U0694_06795 [Anaerolineae bacterium]